MQPASHRLSNPLYLALGCYISWGLFPIYWKLLAHIPAPETLSHRFIWAFVFYLAIFAVRALRDGSFIVKPRKEDWLLAIGATLLLGINWGIYIHAVNTNRILQGSLAYFINPLLSVAVGVALFKEPFPRLLKFAFIMALIGVAIQMAYGSEFPWIALILAVSFCAYGVLKKKVKIGATQFSLMEGAMGLLPALLAAWIFREQAAAPLATMDWVLLVGGGIVTGLPLFLFAMAAPRLPYSLMGMLQFIGPTLQFAVGILLYGETLETMELVSFAFIWGGVGCYLIDKMNRARLARREDTPVPPEPQLTR